MYDDARIDDEFAAWTDRLLAGEDSPAPTESAELASVARQLHRVIAPDAQPAPVFRDQLTQRLNREWTLRHERRSHTWRNRRVLQVGVLAASVIVVLLAVVLILAQESDSGETVQGTALGSIAGVIVVLVVAGSIGLLVAWYQRQK